MSTTAYVSFQRCHFPLMNIRMLKFSAVKKVLVGLLAEESLNGSIRRHRNVTLDKELGQHWFTQQGSFT
jgi:hypothetical protein